MKADVKEIIQIRDDGTQDRVEHGGAFELQGEDLSISFVGLEPLDIVKVTAGLLKTVQRMIPDKEMLKQIFADFSIEVLDEEMQDE